MSEGALLGRVWELRDTEAAGLRGGRGEEDHSQPGKQIHSADFRLLKNKLNVWAKMLT